MVVDLFLVYQFIKRLVTPFNEWKAYEHGIIDEDGNILKKRKDLKTVQERESWGKFDVMILKLKKLLEKAPGGKSRLASYAAALWLIKEGKDYDENMLTEELLEDKLQSYMNIAEELMSEAKTPKPPLWKRAGPNGELEIKFPTGRRFKVEKEYDENERHKGQWKVLEYKTGGWPDDWEWQNTYKPKGFAKQKIMQMGQYDKNGKKVADYSATFQYESVVYEDAPVNAAGAGAIAGIGVGPDGEPGMQKKKQKEYLKKNKSMHLKRFKNTVK